MRTLLLAGSTLLALAASTASATVMYTFNGLGGTATFIYASPDFVSTITTIEAGQLTAATPMITSVRFLPRCSGSGDPSACDELDVQLGLPTYFFLFSNGAFLMDGTYTAANSNNAVLSVTGTPDTAVPEPASLALLGTGLLGLGLVRRRRRSIVST